MIILSLVMAVGASGLGIITGLAGYVSLGQGAFLGLGGYTIGILATRFDSLSPWIWVPVAGVVTTIVSIGLGLVALRASGASFVIITLAFLFLVQVIAINWAGLTDGTTGITLPLPDVGPRLHELAVLLRAHGDPHAAAAAGVADPPDQAWHGAHRDPGG